MLPPSPRPPPPIASIASPVSKRGLTRELAGPHTDLRGLKIVGIALTAAVGKVLTLTGRVVVEEPVEDASAGAPRWGELAQGRQSFGRLPGSPLLEMGCRGEEVMLLSLRCPLKELIHAFCFFV